MYIRTQRALAVGVSVKQDKAKVKRKTPFTIKLLYDTTEYTHMYEDSSK